MKKQQQREDNYFAKKGVSFNRTQQNLEGLKDTTARNIIYMEDTKLKKAQLDEKLEEALFDEKQITAKRQASEYILLYIQLLETLEKYLFFSLIYYSNKKIVDLLSRQNLQAFNLMFLGKSLLEVVQ